MRIKDIAREAGVSTATVSHVINNTKYVSDETREKVQRAIEEWEQLASRTYQSETERYLAEAYLSSDATAALAWAKRAVATAQAVQALDQEGIALQVLGTVHASRGEMPDSLAALERSREILRGTSERQELARTLAGLARALRALPPDDARRSEADQLDSEAAGIFRELGAELDLRRLPAG